MSRLPPKSTRTYTLCPSTTLCRSLGWLRVDQPRSAARAWQPPVPAGDAAVRGRAGAVLAGGRTLPAARHRQPGALVALAGAGRRPLPGPVLALPRPRRRIFRRAGCLRRTVVLRVPFPSVPGLAAVVLRER